MKAFKRLGQTHVDVLVGKNEDGSDKIVSCRLLKMERLAEYKDLTKRLFNVKDLKELDILKERIIALIRESGLPDEYAANLMRLDINELTEFLGYLMYGDTEENITGSSSDDAKKKQ